MSSSFKQSEIASTTTIEFPFCSSVFKVHGNKLLGSLAALCKTEYGSGERENFSNNTWSHLRLLTLVVLSERQNQESSKHCNKIIAKLQSLRKSESA
nr:AlNc14C48G3825 [Albugo laibachii Nc14]CCA18441.1 AlNc14C50G3964 [Albugo laibachii Nc14]|eukprot:CCA18441.1 AlNc14C50G3964 [Albugo laibachii Nc14]